MERPQSRFLMPTRSESEIKRSKVPATLVLSLLRFILPKVRVSDSARNAHRGLDVDPDTFSNVGDTQMIYLNPQCNDDISKCDVDNSRTYEITDFFDFR